MKVTLQFSILVLFLFFGVLMGIQTAEKGIYRIEGAPQGTVTQSLHLSSKGEGQLEVAVLGKTYQAPDAIKQVKHTKNRVSEIGNGIGHWLTDVTRKGLEWIIKTVEGHT
jgi:hypothetical protein